jgi:hypothetical protein
MQRGRSLLILLVVALGLGGYIYFVESKRDLTDPKFAPKGKVFTVDSAKIEEIQVTAADGKTTTLKRDGTLWKITAPEALEPDTSQTSTMLTTIETLDIQRVINEKPAGVKDYGLDPPRFKVAFRLAGETAFKTLNVGNKTPTGSDIYAQVEGDPKLFLINSYTEESLNRTTFDLREKTALKFQRDAVDAITLDVAGNPSVALAKKGQDWRLAKPVDAKADFGTADGLVSRLEQARMKSIVSPTAPTAAADIKKYGFDKPQATVTLGAGSTRASLVIGAKLEDGSLYARDLSRPIVFTVEAGLLEDLKKKPDDIRVKDVFQFRSFSALGLDLTVGGQTFSFAKEKQAVKDQSPANDVWKQKAPAAKDVDQTKFTDLLTTLSNLRADKFADKPVTGGEEIVVVARSGDAAGPVTEKVTLRKAGDVVHAMREGETGAAIIPAAEFDKARALIKEIAGK